MIQETDRLSSKNIYRALLNDLKPNTNYETIIFYDSSHSINVNFKTLPDVKDSKTSIKIMNVGDSNIY